MNFSLTDSLLSTFHSPRIHRRAAVLRPLPPPPSSCSRVPSFPMSTSEVVVVDVVVDRAVLEGGIGDAAGIGCRELFV